MPVTEDPRIRVMAQDFATQVQELTNAISAQTEAARQTAEINARTLASLERIEGLLVNSYVSLIRKLLYIIAFQAVTIAAIVGSKILLPIIP